MLLNLCDETLFPCAILSRLDDFHVSTILLLIKVTIVVKLHALYNFDFVINEYCC